MSVSLGDRDDVLLALTRMDHLIERLHQHITHELSSHSIGSTTAFSPAGSSHSLLSSNRINSIHHPTHNATLAQQPLINTSPNHSSLINTPTLTALLSSLLEACHLCQSVYTTLLPKSHQHHPRDLKLLTIHKRKQFSFSSVCNRVFALLEGNTTSTSPFPSLP